MVPPTATIQPAANMPTYIEIGGGIISGAVYSSQVMAESAAMRELNKRNRLQVHEILGGQGDRSSLSGPGH